MTKLIESKNQGKRIARQGAKRIFGPFYAAYRLSARRAGSLFWSVFGPAAQYDFGSPKYAYASMKP